MRKQRLRIKPMDLALCLNTLATEPDFKNPLKAKQIYTWLINHRLLDSIYEGRSCQALGIAIRSTCRFLTNVEVININHRGNDIHINGLVESKITESLQSPYGPRSSDS